MRQEILISRVEAISPFDGKGMTYKQVAELVGIHEATVKRYSSIFDLDIGFPRGGKKPQVIAFNGKLDEIRKLAAEGKTRAEAGEITGLSAHMVGVYAREHDISFKHASIKDDKGRAKAMCAMFKAGKTLAQIGDLYGVTRERVRQVIKKSEGLVGLEGGQSALASRRREQAKARRNAASVLKHGCRYDQYRRLVEIGREMVAAGIGAYCTPTRAFASQRQNAKARDIEWKLTLWEWWSIWQDSGKWDERGRAGDKFVMCRFSDDGAYEFGNVYIATLAHNSSFQPNNPYRKDHPDHANAVRQMNISGRKRAVRKRVYHDLPVGVTKQKCNGRFIAQIGISGKNKYLGTFSTPELAHEAYQAALRSVSSKAITAAEEAGR